MREVRSSSACSKSQELESPPLVCGTLKGFPAFNYTDPEIHHQQNCLPCHQSTKVTQVGGYQDRSPPMLVWYIGR